VTTLDEMLDRLLLARFQPLTFDLGCKPGIAGWYASTIVNRQWDAQLERRYDRGLRSAPDKIRQDASEGPNNDASV